MNEHSAVTRSKNMIDMANEINEYVTDYGRDHPEIAVKELKKMEMYMRKAYIMYRQFDMLRDEGVSADDPTAWVRKMNGSLVRDQRYIKMRDGLDEYEI